MGKTTKTGGDAVREEQSAPGMPQYNQLQEDSFKRPEPIRVITAVPKAKEMETLALISALLLTVAGSGLFAGEGVEERYIFVNTTEYGVRTSQASASSLASGRSSCTAWPSSASSARR